ncbi:hypothetical protein Tco_0206490 [Tanacetum coccineum]
MWFTTSLSIHPWYQGYDLTHLELVFEFSIYTVWKSVRYGVSNGLDTAYWGFLEQRPRLISSKIFTYYISNTAYWSSLDTAYRSCFLRGLDTAYQHQDFTRKRVWPIPNTSYQTASIRHLFTYDIQNIKTYDEYERELNNDIARGAEEPWWYDELADGKLKDETLALKAKVKGSWGDATPKVNAHEIAPFTRIKNFGWGPYANMKTEWTSNPYLDVNHIFGRNYEASNIGDAQENQGQEKHKESEYLDHSKDSLDAYRELLRLINEGWAVPTPEEE